MSEKHYNADYLVDTAKILKEIKLNSYKYFAGLQDGKVADIGCGTGFDVANMAQMFADKIKVIGLDHDKALIEIAQKNIPEGLNAEFLVSEVNKMAFEDNELDGLRAERLVQHLPDAEKVFTEMKRVLKPGAKCVIVETDWSSLCFYNGDITVADKIVNYLTKDKIHNGYASKKLVHYFEEAKFVNTHIEVFPLIANKLQDVFTYLWIDKIILEMVEKSFLTQQEMESFTHQLEAADHTNSFICSMNIVVCVAEKS